MPSQYELWWIRGVIISISTGRPDVGAQAGDEFTVLNVFDIDRETGRTVTLRGVPNANDFEPNDPVSIFGHRIKGTTGPKPRYILNHNTGKHHKAYYNFVREEGITPHPLAIKGLLDNWLKAEVEIGAFGKLIANLIFYGGPAFLIWYILQWNGLKTVEDYIGLLKVENILVIPIVACFIWLPWHYLLAWFYDPYTHKFVDLAHIYNKVAKDIFAHVERNQEPEKFFVVSWRGTQASGLSKD